MIILVRHGRTVFNDEGRFQGTRDSPLTALGMKQAQEAGLLLGGLRLGNITLWSSPLRRALRSAEIIRDASGVRCGINVDNRLREVALGSWEGLTKDEIEANYPGTLDPATQLPPFFQAPGGESFNEAAERLRTWLDEISALRGAHVVVSHKLSGYVLRSLYSTSHTPIVLDVPQNAMFLLKSGKCSLLKVSLDQPSREILSEDYLT